MATIRIGSKHPVRKAVASLATYHDGFHESFDAIDAILKDHNLMINQTAMINLNSQNDRATGEGAAGTVILNIATRDGGMTCDGCSDKIDNANYANGVSYSWYRMSSGKLEITAYISL